MSKPTSCASKDGCFTGKAVTERSGGPTSAATCKATGGG